jgi:ATP-binding cassette subfamily B protein
MSGVVNTLQESLIGARRVFEVLDADAPIAPQPSTAGARPRSAARGCLRFEQVGFAHSPGHELLRGIDFELRPGECVALFGAAGAGKSTLLSLVPRFHEVSSGRILLDGCDIRELPLAGLRASLGCVFQETFLFSHSVAANIAFGHPEASREQIRRAAQLACADEFIEALPRGYDTLLGEFGANLSGGQRQRLSLARALLREPRILILDDPTAALDPHTAHEIVSGLRPGLRGRSALLATHHPALLRSADRILVLHEGRVIQSGSYPQLSAAEGPFADVFGRRRSSPGLLEGQLG